MSYWYAIQTIGGKEGKSKEKVMRAFPEIKTLLPRRRLEIRRQGKTLSFVKALFPSYFFIENNRPLDFDKAKKIVEAGKRIGNSRGIIQILGNWVSGKDHKRETISPICEEEMKHILFLVKKDEIVGFSKYEKIGQKVRIVDGPLLGHEAIIRKVNPRKKRITVSLRIFGVDKYIDLGGEMIERVST